MYMYANYIIAAVILFAKGIIIMSRDLVKWTAYTLHVCV